MKKFFQLKAEIQTALSHLLLRILCLLIIEYECANLVQQSSGTPAVMGNYILSSLFAIALLLTLFKRKLGLIIGMATGVINIIAKVVIIFSGHEHFPYYPIVWITQSVIVIYFCYKAYKAEQVTAGFINKDIIKAKEMREVINE